MEIENIDIQPIFTEPSTTKSMFPPQKKKKKKN